MSNLFSHLEIRSVTLKNRIVMSPMCQYSSVDGYINDWHVVHYGTRAAGGAGLIMREATAISPEGRITPRDLGLWKDEHIEGHSGVVRFEHQHGAASGIQLAHAGRKSSCAAPIDGGKQLDFKDGGWQTMAPSDIPFQSGERAPRQMDKEDLKKVISDFKAAAARAVIAGYDVVEIHSAHGYLLQEFLSPISNHRNDEYGGSLENRSRLLLEVISAVRSVWSEEKPLIVRISSTDWTEGGWTLEDSVRLAPLLKNAGVDIIDCSSGGNVHNAKIPVGPGYQVPFSEAIRKTGIMTGAVGFITAPSQAETILREGKADLVLMARELLRNPYFPLVAARELGEDVKWPVQYTRAK